MSDAFDPQQQLETIRSLMERARNYRHPPAAMGLLAGGGGCLGGWLTHGAAPEPVRLGATWGAIFFVLVVAVVWFSWRQARADGTAFWSPLARDVLHALWPPLIAAGVLTVALWRAGRPEAVPIVWMLLYGVGGIAAGAFASPVVRALGLAFFAAGLAQLALELPPGVALGATFGGLHLLYGAVLLVRAKD